MSTLRRVYRLWSSGSWTAPGRHPSAPWGEHLSTPRERQSTPISTGSHASHRHPLHSHARARSRRPDCTLSRLATLTAEEYDRPVTQSIVTLEPGCPGPHPRLSRSSLRSWVCHHTREPTVLSRVGCRPAHLTVFRFHQPCLLPGRIPR